MDHISAKLELLGQLPAVSAGPFGVRPTRSFRHKTDSRVGSGLECLQSGCMEDELSSDTRAEQFQG